MQFYQQPWVMVASDSGRQPPPRRRRHVRVLGKYVRDNK
jgi:hypothetical protein